MGAGLLARAAQLGSRLEAAALGLQLCLMLLAAILLEAAGKLAGKLKRPMNAVDDAGHCAEAGMKRKVCLSTVSNALIGQRQEGWA